PHQQRIPLKLPATAAGLRQIEREAKVIAAQLIERRFSWASYLSQEEETSPESLPLPDCIADLRRTFWPSAAPVSPLWPRAKPPGTKPTPPTSRNSWLRQSSTPGSRWMLPSSLP
ncbi:MAG: hypothetical protein DCF21_20960, partial [Leptolyngbya sp.]